MSANLEADNSANPIPFQEAKPLGALTEKLLGHIIVRAKLPSFESVSLVSNADAHPGEDDKGTSSPTAHRVRRKRKKGYRKRRGGWPHSPRLTWDDVKAFGSAVHELVRLGLPPTYRITVMPLLGAGATPSKRKRACQKKLDRILEALKRHGYPRIAVTVFEHPLVHDLHCHSLVHVPAGAEAILWRFHSQPEVMVQRIDERRGGLRGAVAYAMKERKHFSPDFEKSIRLPWRPCRPVPGKRWTMTEEARTVLSGPVVKARAAAPTAALDAVVVDHAALLVFAPHQLLLPIATPVIDIFAAAELKRKDLGLSQRQAAESLGIRQSHWSNSIVRHHDTLSPWAINRVRDFIADRIAA